MLSGDVILQPYKSPPPPPARGGAPAASRRQARCHIAFAVGKNTFGSEDAGMHCACRGCRVQFGMSAAGKMGVSARRARRKAPPHSRATGVVLLLSVGERVFRQWLAGLWCGLV